MTHTPTIHAGTKPRPAYAQSLRIAAGDIKLAHSVFALPFAVLAAFLAREPASPWRHFALQLALVVFCMVLARTWAMLFNRLADRDIDARNERTARRALASGTLSPTRGWTIALASAALFVVGTGGFYLLDRNPWPMILAAPVLAWIAFYSITKRFTALCHVFLGGALGASPIAAVIAIRPASLPMLFESSAAAAGTAPSWTIPLLALFVVLWVAGFDVIYALQDLEFDRRENLRSIPARLGPRGAAWVARLLHAGAFGVLILAWHREPRFGPIVLGAVALVGVILTLEHTIVARRGLAGIPMAFFTLNGVVSLVLGAAGCAEVVMGA